ncbi:MAG: asparagine synthase (glutamine-hydrolyzing) [Flavitalea sp.]
MCGITGIISFEPGRFDAEAVRKMTAAVAHRGPDGESFWNNDSGKVSFGHRRLAIIDLSENGKQAMHYENRYTIIYNGEIYNYVEIREQLKLKGYRFETHSDTEVILAAYSCFKESCLELFDGMFAFAIWDEDQQSFFAARDRFGEKPFYYFFDDLNNRLCFASEIKALTAGGVTTTVRSDMLLAYLSLGSVDDPTDGEATFYNQIKQIPAAHFLLYDLVKKKIDIKRYWALNKENQVSISEEEAIETFTRLFTTSVTRRLRSDVPLGTSLSGGLDSSALSAIINNHVNPPIHRKTFSSVFPGFARDESRYIKKVTDTFQLENYSVSPTVEEFTNDFEKLLFHHEYPISSASVYLQYRVFELAKKHNVKVLLDGQGADEILAGYTRYIHWFLQELLDQNKFSEFKYQRKTLQENQVPFKWGWKNYVAAKFPEVPKTFLENKQVKSIESNNDLDVDFVKEYFNRSFIYKPAVSKLNDLLYFTTCEYGLTELLRYADRNSMAHGREVRLPFLNHELVEFIFSLPSNYKIHRGWTKWILRKSIEDKLPAQIVWRKDKIGFEPPQKSWMENKLVIDYLHESKKILVSNKVLRPSVLRKKNQPHDAYAADNFDWRYLVAGQLLKSQFLHK